MALPGNPKDILSLWQWFSNFAAYWNHLGNFDVWLLPPDIFIGIGCDWGIGSTGDAHILQSLGLTGLWV